MQQIVVLLRKFVNLKKKYKNTYASLERCQYDCKNTNSPLNEVSQILESISEPTTIIYPKEEIYVSTSFLKTVL